MTVAAALRHHLGARYGIVHGYASTILTPHVLEYNRPATDAAQTRIAQALGGPDAGSAADEFRAVGSSVASACRPGYATSTCRARTSA